jgi:hypothetical protein
MCAAVSPNENDLVTGPGKFGDGKSESNQSLTADVTNVTSVTNIFDKGFRGASPVISGPVRAREAVRTGGLVKAADEFCDQYAHTRARGCRQVAPTLTAEWREGIERIRSMSPVNGYTPEQWGQLIRDADAFLDRWGATASALGWTTLDLFAIHPTAPAVRYDAKGLIPCLHGNAVAELSEDAATIRTRSGSALRFYRSVGNRTTCLWEVSQ